MARTVVITSGKGGVGKSTMTALIGKSLAKMGKKVVLIDADLGLKNLDVILGLEARVIYDLEDVLKGRCALSQALVQDKEEENLFLLPACLRLDVTSIREDHLTTIIQELEPQFDFIFIDSPAGIEQGFLNAVHHAKEAIVVVTLDRSSLRDADKVVGLLRSRGINQIHGIINAVPKKRKENDAYLTKEDVTRVLSIPLLGVINEDTSIRKMQNWNAPLHADVQNNFFEIAGRITGEKPLKYMANFWSRIMKKVHTS